MEISIKLKKFVLGDDILADTSSCVFGGFAEYVAIPEKLLVKKPADMTFGTSAALPTASVM